MLHKYIVLTQVSTNIMKCISTWMKFVEIKIWLCVCKSSQNVKKLPKFIKSIKNSLNKVDSYLEVCE